MNKGKRPPLALVILDGFGEAPASEANAISLATPACWLDLRQRYPSTTLDCSGQEVGLPCGLMGNSEVGHLNIGAGRIVWQEITRIDEAIADRSFFTNEALVGAVRHTEQSGGVLHLMGLVSDGGVHSSDSHLKALIAMARDGGLTGDRVVLHAILDGRDTPPRSAGGYIADIEGEMATLGAGRIATVSGRFWAMDRDQRWDRITKAYEAVAKGVGNCSESAQAAIREGYQRDEGDEFLEPTIIGSRDAGRLRDGDAVVFFNFRADRARQMTAALLEDEFKGFDRGPRPEVHFVSMTGYRGDFICPVAFPPRYLKGIFPEVVSKAGLSQLRIAETEKYAHVTFFFSGGDEKAMAGERRILVPSPKVRTYDQAPGMSAREVTDELLRVLDEDPPDVTILNFANGDMVGHTGVIPATIEAIRVMDECLARIVPAYVSRGGHVAITADHGNCEKMVDPQTGQPHTAHTTNPVPLLIAGSTVEGQSMKEGGRLCDIAPTLLSVMGLEPTPSMEGVSLL